MRGYLVKDIYTYTVSQVKLHCKAIQIVNGATYTADTVLDVDWNPNCGASGYTPYQDFTEALVLQKTFDNYLDKNYVESNLAAELWQKINIVEFPLPWV